LTPQIFLGLEVFNFKGIKFGVLGKGPFKVWLRPFLGLGRELKVWGGLLKVGNFLGGPKVIPYPQEGGESLEFFISQNSPNLTTFPLASKVWTFLKVVGVGKKTLGVLIN